MIFTEGVHHGVDEVRLFFIHGFGFGEVELDAARFPPPYITAYYREAGEAIARFLASGMIDFAILDNSIAALSQKVAGNVTHHDTTPA